MSNNNARDTGQVASYPGLPLWKKHIYCYWHSLVVHYSVGIVSASVEHHLALNGVVVLERKNCIAPVLSHVHIFSCRCGHSNAILYYGSSQFFGTYFDAEECK